MISRNTKRRSGAALILVVLIIAILAVTLGSITVQNVSTRRVLGQRERQLQAAWLARSGVELAVQKWQVDPKAYSGETIALIPESQIAISVLAVNQEEIAITCEARYPIDQPGAVTRSVRRVFRRIAEGDKIRLEAH